MKPLRRGTYRLWRVELQATRPLVWRDYTAKIPRTLLAKADPRLREIITSHQPGPKPLHLTPLYLEEEGRKKAIYPHSPRPGEPAKPVVLQPGRTYSFYIGYDEALLPHLPSVLIAASGQEIGGARIHLASAQEVLAYSPAGSPIYEPKTGQRIKIILSAPTLPTSPFHQSKLKRLTNSPLHIFATNMKELYPAKEPKALEALDLLVPNPPDSKNPRLRTTWYQYGDNQLPGLTGYIIYNIDETTEETHLETIAHILSHAVIMGAGSGRAAGFGHIEVHPLTQPLSPVRSRTAPGELKPGPIHTEKQ